MKVFIGNLLPLTLGTEIEKGWPGRRRVPPGPKGKGAANSIPHFRKDKPALTWPRQPICGPSFELCWASKTHSRKVRSGRIRSLCLTRVVQFFLLQPGMYAPRVTQWSLLPKFPTDLLSPHQWQGHPKSTLDEKPQWQTHTTSLPLLSSSFSAISGHTCVDLQTIQGLQCLLHRCTTSLEASYTLEVPSCPQTYKNCP